MSYCCDLSTGVEGWHHHTEHEQWRRFRGLFLVVSSYQGWNWFVSPVHCRPMYEGKAANEEQAKARATAVVMKLIELENLVLEYDGEASKR